MGGTGGDATGVPEIDLTDAEVIRDPFTTYGRVRERSPLARLLIPGLAPMWALTRHDDARAMLADPRFEIRADSFMRPDVPEVCLPYMRTMSEMNGPEHARLRGLVSPAFTARRAADFGSVGALLSHPAQLAALRADPGIMPRAVEELILWCGPTLLSIPRYAREDLELVSTTVRAGETVTAVVAAAIRDPRAFTSPDRLDIGRAQGPVGHLGFAHGPHFCLGASLARVQTGIALTALLRRFPGLALTVAPDALRAPDPGTWRLTALPVTL